MKTWFLLLATIAFISRGNAADALTERLQQGLFEEEANQNLSAAIKTYEGIVQQNDQQRKLVATALFRLAECYRKLGKTNEANACYGRVLRDYSEQEQLTRLAAQFLPATAPAQRTNAVADASSPSDAEAKELSRVQALAQNSPDLLNSSTGGSLPLTRAVLMRYYTVAEYLLNHGANVNNRSPLALAAENGDLRMVELLLSRGADVNGVGEGMTPLMASAALGHRAVLEKLLASNAVVNFQDETGCAAIHFAALNGHAALVELLLIAGGKPDLLAKRYNWTAFNRESATPLHLAAMNGYTKVAESLLAHGGSVNVANEAGRTPLHTAVANRRPQMCSLLLQRAANANAHLSDGQTPLNLAINLADAEIAGILLKNGANVNERNPSGHRYPLFAAITSTEPVLNAVLGAKPNLEVTNDFGWTPLLVAITTDRRSDGSSPVRPGAPPGPGSPITINFADSGSGAGPIGYDPVLVLLRAGANPNVVTAKGNTPLHFALIRGADVVAALLDRGANPNVINQSGSTPLSLVLAALAGKRNVQRNGDDVSVGQYGAPVWLAEAADLLRDHGADAFLHRRRLISVMRKDNRPWDIFVSGTNQVNRYTLMELIATMHQYNGFAGTYEWPDFSVLNIRRLEDRRETSLSVDMQAVFNSRDCSRDIPLQWGDIVEVPMRDHPVGYSWPGLDTNAFFTLTNCLTRQVTLRVLGHTNAALTLVPPLTRTPSFNAGWPSSFFRLAHVLRYSCGHLLLASSDLTRVTVIRTNAESKNIERITEDTTLVELPNLSVSAQWNSNPGSAAPRIIPWSQDIWLKDGDIIEVPEKSAHSQSSNPTSATRASPAGALPAAPGTRILPATPRP